MHMRNNSNANMQRKTFRLYVYIKAVAYKIIKKCSSYFYIFSFSFCLIVIAGYASSKLYIYRCIIRKIKCLLYINFILQCAYAGRVCIPITLKIA